MRFDPDVIPETIDFGEIDKLIFAPYKPPSIKNWVKPQAKQKMVDSATGEVFVPTPVTVKKSKCDESGGMSIEFERPVIVPPFFVGKGNLENIKRRLQDKEFDQETSDALKEILTFKI